MFEKFTQQARAVIVLAEKEAGLNRPGNPRDSSAWRSRLGTTAVSRVAPCLRSSLGCPRIARLQRLATALIIQSAEQVVRITSLREGPLCAYKGRSSSAHAVDPIGAAASNQVTESVAVSC